MKRYSIQLQWTLESPATPKNPQDQVPAPAPAVADLTVDVYSTCAKRAAGNAKQVYGWLRGYVPTVLSCTRVYEDLVNSGDLEINSPL